jgi:hypothetical protein
LEEISPIGIHALAKSGTVAVSVTLFKFIIP